MLEALFCFVLFIILSISMIILSFSVSFFFFFIVTPTTEIYSLSLHDALPISPPGTPRARCSAHTSAARAARTPVPGSGPRSGRSEEHTSELQSRFDLVCRLLLEKKKYKL